MGGNSEDVLDSTSVVKVEMMTEEEFCQIKVEGCVCSECSGECSTDRFVQDMTDQPQCGSNYESDGIKEELHEFKVDIDDVKEEVYVRLTDQPHSGLNNIETEMLDVKIDFNFQKDSACKELFKFPEEDLATNNSECLKKQHFQSDESIQNKSTGSLDKFGNKFKCFTCNYATNKSNNLKKHKMASKHKEKMFKSSEVDFATKKTKCLKKPRAEIQSDESIQNEGTVGLGKFAKKFNCFACNYATNKSNDLKKHKMTSKHKGISLKNSCLSACGRPRKYQTSEKKFKCSVCNYASNHQTDIKRHQLAHANKKPFKCSKCNFTSNYENSLKVHYRNIHSKVRSKTDLEFKCSKCNYVTKRRGYLEKHQSKTHNTTATINLHKLKQRIEKIHKCLVCNYTTLVIGDLRKHQLHAHSVEKPFKCGKCNFASNYKQSLSKHYKTKIHSETMSRAEAASYSATKHDKSFEEHQKIDNCSEEYFECSGCDFTSKFTNYLKNDEKLVHACHRKMPYCSESLRNISEYTFNARKKSRSNRRWHYGRLNPSDKKLSCIDCDFETYDEISLILHFQSPEHDSSVALN